MRILLHFILFNMQYGNKQLDLVNFRETFVLIHQLEVGKPYLMHCLLFNLF
ncbi:hypothetical protein MKX01_013285 [Papaver californicum]|nr:hypothetical protein MKX01_013285 [Papaver californicum]